MSNKVPQIRFNGYSDDWEERKLGDVGNTFTGLTGKTKEDFGHGSAKFVTYVNVFQNSIATLDQLDAIEIDEKQNQVQKGDIFFTTSSETPEEVGMSSVWTHDTENVYLNSFTFGYRPRVSFDLNYMASMLRSPSIRKKITFLAQGISRYNISKTKMLEIEIPTPTLSEQEKIGSFFKQLDNTIALHQRKLDLLKEQKKGYLQKMFPKNGAKVPELRFAGFADDWLQRKLSDGYKKIRNAFVGTATPFYVESGHFYLESNNVKNGQLNFNSKVFINDEFYQKQTDQLLNTGDLVMVQSGHVGHTAVIPEKLDGTAAHALIMFKNNDGSFDSNFVNQYFQTDRAKNAISIITTGNTIKHILASDMQKFDVMVPSVEEQKQISLLLQRLDNLIAANQRKLDLLKEQKKGFLQNMFV